MRGTVIFQPKLMNLLFILLFAVSSGFAEDLPDPKVHNLVKNGLRSLVNGDYDDALANFQKLDRDFKYLPLGKIYLASYEIAIATDYALPYNDKKIQNLLYLAEAQCQELLKKDNNKWNRYYLALTEGYNTLYAGLTNDWFNLIYEGIESISDYKEILKMDPDFSEAYVAIGSFKYWSSENMRYFTWLPFFEDERELGLKYLNKSKTDYSYHDYIALDVLFWIMVGKQEFNKARSIAEESLSRYPGSRLFRSNLARAYEAIDKKKAIETYQQVLNSFEPQRVKNRYNEILIKSKMAALYLAMGDSISAYEITKYLLGLKNLTGHELKLLDGRMDKVRKTHEAAKAALGKK